MTQALENAIEQIVTVLRSVEGLKWVPINPTETASYDTFAIVYPNSGEIDLASVAYRKSLHTIAIDVLTKRTDIARSFERLKPLIDLVTYALLAEMTITEVGGTGGIFNNSIDTYSSLSYNLIANNDYGGIAVIGYHFVMNDVKIMTTL